MGVIANAPRQTMPQIPDAMHGLLGVEDLEALFDEVGGTGPALASGLLRRLGVTLGVPSKDLACIPRRGPVLLVANHPHGLLDGAALASMLSTVRGDVKFLANALLAGIPQFTANVIAVDPMGGASATRANPRGVKAAIAFLAGGGMLVAFPAGEVSSFNWRKRRVADPAWSEGVARILELAARRVSGINVVPLHIEGRNSLLFQALGLIHPRLRTAMLLREFLNKTGRRVGVRIGAPIAAEKLASIPTAAGRTDYLRWRTEQLGQCGGFKAMLSRPLRRGREAAVPLAEPVAPDLLIADVRRLEPLAESGDLRVYLGRAAELPNVLAEIGRLRELTFRLAGEGTGKAADIDKFDQSYLHLFVWNAAKGEVVGGYRLTPPASDLYTATLFRYSPDFTRLLGPALELGRSFIRPEYQKGFAPLLLLWKGIGKFIARNPQYKTLFGPVSISGEYHPAARSMIAVYLRRHAWLGELASLVTSRRAFRPLASTPVALDLEDLSAAVADIHPGGAGIPVLLRQYLKLGGKLLGFNVDKDFANVLDGLIVVDLTRTEPKLLDRYFGSSEAAAFRRFHGI